MRTSEHSSAEPVRTTAQATTSFFPLTTIKCDGRAVFRSQAARDVGCLLDVDESVLSWSCQPLGQGGDSECGTPDFLVSRYDGGLEYLDAPDREDTDTALHGRLGHNYRKLSNEEVYGGFRLQNARDLLRYGIWRTGLGDRVRLLAALDEHGSLTFAECLNAIQETKPVAGVAALILAGQIELDLDSALLGPETMVRRIRP